MIKKNLLKIIKLIKYYKFGLFRIACRELEYRFYSLSGLKKMLVANVYGLQVKVPTTVNGIGRALFVFQGRELDHKWILEKTLKDGDHVLDIGGNIGYYPLLEARLISTGGRIFCVEPDPRNFAILKLNIESSNFKDFIHVSNMALSNFTGVSYLRLESRANLSRLIEQKNFPMAENLAKVSVRDLSDYVMEIGEIDMVRMDVEGHEVHLFESIVSGFKKEPNLPLPRRIIFETHYYGNNRTRMVSALTSLFDIGYRIEYLTSDDEGQTIPSIISGRGYKPIQIVNEWHRMRGIYENISRNHGIDLISNYVGTRTACLLHA